MSKIVLFRPDGSWRYKNVEIEKAHVLMLEPWGTAHTGDTSSELTVDEEKQEWI